MSFSKKELMTIIDKFPDNAEIIINCKCKYETDRGSREKILFSRVQSVEYDELINEIIIKGEDR